MEEETGFGFSRLSPVFPVDFFPHHRARDVCLPVVGPQRHTDTCWSGKELAQLLLKIIVAYTTEMLLNETAKKLYVLM